MAQVNAGRVRFVSRGEYNNSTQYYLFDLVNYEGSSYVAIGNTLGNLPTNTTYWQLIAEKGNVGSVGPVGPQGVGIASVTKTSSEGLVDTYTITYTDGTTSTFQITNGEDGETPLSEFNALKERVEDLEDNQITLPAEGTNIHVEDAAKARLYEFEFEKESSQHTTSGKNLFDGELVRGSIGAESNIRLRSVNQINVQSNTTYTLNLESLYTIQTIVYEYDEEDNRTQKTTSWNDLPYTFSTLSTTKKIRFVLRIQNNEELLIEDISKVQLEPEDTATEWEEYTGGQPSPNPDYPQSVKVVEGYRNLFDKNNVNIYNGYISSSGSHLLNDSVNSKTLYINIKPNTTYTMQKILSNYFRIGYTTNLPSNLVPVMGFKQTTTLTSQSITTGADAKYLVCNYWTNTDIITEQEILDSIQIVEGDQELPYVPYGNNYIAVNISDGTNTNQVPLPLNGNEIAGIGNYLDEYIVDKSGHCWLEKNYYREVIQKNDIKVNSIETDYVQFLTPVLSYSLKENISNNDMLSNITLIAGTTTSNKIRFNVSHEILGTTSSSTWEEVKTALLNLLSDVDEILFYYPLATPQTIDLNTTVDLKLFKGVNNITNSEDGNMRIRYVESIDSIINDFNTRLKALEQGESL